MICSICPKTFEKGAICPVCSKIFCIEHNLSSCPFCKIKIDLEKITSKTEKIGKVSVDWLTKNGKQRSGISGISNPPPYLMKIQSIVNSANNNIKIVLFESKNKSIKSNLQNIKSQTTQNTNLV